MSNAKINSPPYGAEESAFISVNLGLKEIFRGREMFRFQAAVLTHPQKLELKEIEKPELEESEAIIDVLYAGVCGTDIAIYNGDYKVPLPLVLGHEFVGMVAEVAEPEFNYLVGKTSVAEINNSCIAFMRTELCPACERGLPNHCLRRTVLGILEADGAFAERVIVPTRNIHPLPPDFKPSELGVFIEPLAAAVQTFELSPIVRNNIVVVLGAGRLGILLALVAARLGAQTIVADLDEEKLIPAKKIIKDVETLSASDTERFIRHIARRTNHLGADIVVEATGTIQGLEIALQICRPRGTIALKSTPGVNLTEFDITRTVVNEIRLQGSRCGSFDKAIEFIQRYEPPLTSLIAEILPLKRATEALQHAKYLHKVLIQP